MSEALKKALASKGERFAPTTSRALRSAEVVPGSANGDGAIEMVVATSAAVTRSYYDWWDDEIVEYDEVLPVANCRLPEQSGRSVNLLDSHNWWSCKSIIGLGTAFRVEGEQILGTFALSERESVADIVEGIREGIIRNGSCGYVIDRYTVSDINGRMTLTADEWTLLEMSVVPVPADGASQMRSAGEMIAAHRTANPKKSGKKKMTDDEIKALVAEAVRTAVASAAQPATEGDGAETIEPGTEAGTRAKPAGNPLPAPQNQPQPGARSAEDQAAVDGLRLTAKRYGVEAEFNEFEKTGADLAELRGVVATGMRSKSNRTEIDGLNGGAGKREASMADLRWEDCAAFRGHNAAPSH